MGCLILDPPLAGAIGPRHPIDHPACACTAADKLGLQLQRLGAIAALAVYAVRVAPEKSAGLLGGVARDRDGLSQGVVSGIVPIAKRDLVVDF